jgi:protein-S-isoprenylcysteine O-methyltransferase Ste14
MSNILIVLGVTCVLFHAGFTTFGTVEPPGSPVVLGYVLVVLGLWGGMVRWLSAFSSEQAAKRAAERKGAFKFHIDSESLN